jgi:hypothetical protein
MKQPEELFLSVIRPYRPGTDGSYLIRFHSLGEEETERAVEVQKAEVLITATTQPVKPAFRFTSTVEMKNCGGICRVGGALTNLAGRVAWRDFPDPGVMEVTLDPCHPKDSLPAKKIE